MPVELEIIRAREFIRLGGHGEFDLNASCAILTTIAQACKRRGIHTALIDARNARANLSDNEVAALVNVFSGIGFSKHFHLAILHATDRHYRPRLFASMSRMKGWNVRAFENFEEAINWLSGSPEEEAQPEARLAADKEPKPVPIRTARQRPRDNFAKIQSVRTA